MKFGKRPKKWQSVSDVFQVTTDNGWARHKKFPFIAKPDKLAMFIEQMREKNLKLIDEDKFWYYFH